MSEKAPASYRNIKRPLLQEALRLEGGTLEEASASLERKGYFEPPARPWKLGVMDRGLGRANFAVLDAFDDLVVEAGSNSAVAVFIIEAANNYRP